MKVEKVGDEQSEISPSDCENSEMEVDKEIPRVRKGTTRLESKESMDRRSEGDTPRMEYGTKEWKQDYHEGTSAKGMEEEETRPPPTPSWMDKESVIFNEKMFQAW